jgi:hypothetical protein
LDPVVERNDIDAVLVTHLVGVERGETYTPPRYTPAPYYGGLYRYHSRVRGYVYEPGYYSQYELVKLESNLYDAGSGELVWSMQSETMSPDSEQKLIDAQIAAVVKRLKAQKLL